jgi:hypothetical protein
LAKDWDAVSDALDPDVDFRWLTPGQPWEANSARQLIVDVLALWLEPTDDA